MIESNMSIKIIDFGFAVKVKSNSQNLDLFCGTPNYMSPEIVLKKEYKGGPNDIWGFAVLAFKLLTGYFPFASESTSGLNRRILALDFSVPSYVPEPAKNMFNAIFKLSPPGRPTASQLLHFKFFK